MCRKPPFEAAIYSLNAEGEKQEKFNAISKSELTVEVEESLDHQQQQKRQHFSMELPVNFSKEDETKV